MPLREEEFELCHRRLKVVFAVGEAAAADHQIAKMRKIRLTHMLVPVADLLHGHTRKRQDAVNDRFQRCGHAIAIERKA